MNTVSAQQGVVVRKGFILMAKLKESLSGEGEVESYREILTRGDVIHTTLIDLSDADGNIGT